MCVSWVDLLADKLFSNGWKCVITFITSAAEKLDYIANSLFNYRLGLQLNVVVVEYTQTVKTQTVHLSNYRS